MRNLLALLGVSLLAGLAVGCGSPAGTAPVTAAPSAAAAPVPSIAAGSGTEGPYGGTAVAAGSYFIELEGYRYTFAVPTSGWWTNNYGDFLAVGKVHDENGLLTRLFILSDDGGEVFADACHWSGTNSVPGPTVDDLAAALAAIEGFESSEPSVTTIGGFRAKHLQLMVPADVSMADCDNGEYHGVAGFSDISPGQVQDVWVFGADGARRVIMSVTDGTTTTDAQAEVTQFVNSLEIEPTTP